MLHSRSNGPARAMNGCIICCSTISQSAKTTKCWSQVLIHVSSATVSVLHLYTSDKCRRHCNIAMWLSWFADTAQWIGCSISHNIIITWTHQSTYRLICVLVARPRRCHTLSNPVPTKLNGGLFRLHSADEDAVSWLTNYGLWHQYEKKKNRSTVHGRFKPFSEIFTWSYISLHNSVHTVT